MQLEHRRVVVTGLGLVTPLGLNVPESWAGILAGRSGFGPVTRFVPKGHRIAGLCAIENFDPVIFLGAKESRRRDRNQQFAAVATAEAMTMAGLKVTDENRQQIGVFLGTGIGGLETMLSQQHTVATQGARRVSPFGITMIMPNGAAGMTAIDYGLQGPSTTITTACAASSDAIGQAFRYIKMGLVDAAVAGGTEAPIASMTVAGFERAGAISNRSDGTPRPFDKDRDGLIPGEGAGILILESLEFAQARARRFWGNWWGTAKRRMRTTSPLLRRGAWGLVER